MVVWDVDTLYFTNYAGPAKTVIYILSSYQKQKHFKIKWIICACRAKHKDRQMFVDLT